MGAARAHGPHHRDPKEGVIARYRDQDTHARIAGAAGTPAEQAFEAWMGCRGYLLGTHYVRYGADRVDTSAGLMASADGWVAHAPDYLQMGGHLWEVQGCGADRIVRLKKEKLEDLYWRWHRGLSGRRELRWAFFVQPDDRLVLATTDCVLWAVADPRSEWHDQLLDAKGGWEVPVAVLDQRLVVDPFEAAKAAGPGRYDTLEAAA